MRTLPKTTLLATLFLAVGGGVVASEPRADAGSSAPAESSPDVAASGDPVPQFREPPSAPLPRRAGTAPVAVDDRYLVQQEAILTVGSDAGVLVNDLDEDNEFFGIVAAVSPAHGTLQLFAPGNFSYTPDPSFVGIDSFQYRISDGDLLSAFAVVRVDVVPSFNRAPVAVADAYSVARDDTLFLPMPGILGNDYDPDGDGFTVVAGSGPQNGTWDLSIVGRLTYVPDEGFVGEDSFTYRIGDGQSNSNIVTVALDVYEPNRAPIAVPDMYYVPEGGSLDEPLPGVLGNDLDPDGDNFTVVAGTTPENGEYFLSIAGPLEYTPDPGFVGVDAFTYRIGDGNDVSNIVEVTLLVGVFGDIPTGVITPSRPNGFSLRAPTPNPFNPTTTLTFRLERAGTARMIVYDMRGRVVRTLVDGERTAGEATVTWDGRDDVGRRVGSGPYVVELRSGTQRAVQKLQLVK